MATTKEVSIVLRAIDQASATLGQVGRNLAGLQQTVSNVIGAFAGYQLGSGFIGFLKSSVTAAMQAEDAENRLRFAVEASGESWDSVGDDVKGYLSQIQKTTRFSDDEAAEALQRLITITGSYKNAVKALPIALDIAARLHINLESATKAVGLAIEGNTGSLAKFGIKLDDSTKNLLAHATQAERTEIAIAALSKRFAGSAVQDAQTFSGRMKILTNQMDDFKEAVGGALLQLAAVGPDTQAAASSIADLTTIVRHASEAWADMAKQAKEGDLLALLITHAAGLDSLEAMQGLLHKIAEDFNNAEKVAGALKKMIAAANDAPTGIKSATASVEDLTAAANALGVTLGQQQIDDVVKKISVLSAAMKGGASNTAADVEQLRKLNEQLAKLKGNLPMEGKSFQEPLKLGISVEDQDALQDAKRTLREIFSDAAGGSTPLKIAAPDMNPFNDLADAGDAAMESLAHLLNVLDQVGPALSRAADSSLPLDERLGALEEAERGASKEGVTLGDALAGAGRNMGALEGKVAALAGYKDSLAAIGINFQDIRTAVSETQNPMSMILDIWQGIQDTQASGIELTDVQLDQLGELMDRAVETWTHYDRMRLAVDMFKDSVRGVGEALGQAAAAGAKAGALLKAALLHAIANYLRGIGEEQLVAAAASLASYDYSGAALHTAASVLAFAGAGYVDSLASERGKAAKGGIVSGTEIGDRQEFLLEAGETVLPKSLTRAILGGRAVIAPAGAFAASVQAMQAAMDEAQSIQLAPDVVQGLGRLMLSLGPAAGAAPVTYVNHQATSTTTSSSVPGPYSPLARWREDLLDVEQRILEASLKTVDVLDEMQTAIRGSFVELTGAVRDTARDRVKAGWHPVTVETPGGMPPPRIPPSELPGNAPWDDRLPPPGWTRGQDPERYDPGEDIFYQRGPSSAHGGGSGGILGLVAQVAAAAEGLQPLPDISAAASVFTASSGLSRYDDVVRGAASAPYEGKALEDALDTLGDRFEGGFDRVEGAIGTQTRELGEAISRAPRGSATVSATFNGANEDQALQLLEDINRLVRDQGYELNASNLTVKQQ